MHTDIVNSQIKYNENALDLFDEFQWLFKYPVTELLIRDLLNLIPDDWLEVLRKLNYNELNQFAVGELIKSDWPSSLVSFVKRCKTLNKLLKPPEISELKTSTLPLNLCHGLCLKKQHEVTHLVNFIHKQCEAENIRTIVDFGSGLGYICQALNYLYGYRVLGLESNYKINENACKRQLKLFPKSCNDVKYLCRKVDFENMNDIKFIEDNISLLNNGKNEKICAIGLHSCGDLGLTSAFAFTHLHQSKLLIMISCCYHKLEIHENNEIKRFGMSNCLRTAINNHDIKKKLNSDKNETDKIRKILNRPFMRLACQESATRWQQLSDYDHEQHAFCVLSRAVLELFAFKHNFILKKCVKKATRKSQCINFSTYLVDALKRYTFNGNNESNNNELINNIEKIWEENKEKLIDIEIFTALQLLLQAPAESLVLEDRRFWLMELSNINKKINSKIVPIFNSEISPRCQAIVARIEK